MNGPPIADLTSISSGQKSALKRGCIASVSDLILSTPLHVAKRAKIPLGEAQAISCLEQGSKFTTGDSILDEIIGGGIQTGMLWELAGESASGKTQFALQLSLLVQIPQILGGLSGAACYLTTTSRLPTNRLTELSTEHPLLSSTVCSLSDIHTRSAPTLPLLMHTLNVTLPTLIHDLSISPSRKPLKLLVIDSVAGIFHSNDKPSTQGLVERSKALSELSTVVHAISTRYQIAIVAVNEVTDVFDRSMDAEGLDRADVIYSDQTQWFNRAHSVPKECKKEAALGLVWANQVNVRMMMTRTERRRSLEDKPRSSKRRRTAGNQTFPEFARHRGVLDDAGHSVLIRRLSVVFSTVSLSTSVDYIITTKGVSTVPDDVLEERLGKMTNSNTSDVHFLNQRSSNELLPTQSTEKLKKPMKTGTREEPMGYSGDEHMNTYHVIPDVTDAEELSYWAEFDDTIAQTTVDLDFDAIDRSNVESQPYI